MPDFPFPFGAGGGGAGPATAFQLLAADPGAPANGDVWYNTTNQRYRGRDNGVTMTFAAEYEIDVSTYPGANLGEKLQAAHDDGTFTAGILNCEGFTGAQAITSLVTITKKSFIKFGYVVCAVSVGAGILLDTTSFEGGAAGSIISGAGYATQFVGAAGCGPIIQLGARQTKAQNFHVTWAGANAANIGIYAHPSSFSSVGYVNIENVRVIGITKTGVGIQWGICYVGTMDECFVQSCDKNILCEDIGGTAPHAIAMKASESIQANIGIDIEAGNEITLIGMSVEGNTTYGMRVTKAVGIRSLGTRWENTGAVLYQVLYEESGYAFTTIHNHIGDQFILYSGAADNGRNINNDGNSLCHVKVFGGDDANGMSVTGSGTLTLENVGRIATSIDQGDTTKIFVRSSNGWASDGVGYTYGSLTGSAFDQLQAVSSWINTSGTLSAFKATNSPKPTGNSSATYRAITATVTSESASPYTFSMLNAGYFEATHAGDAFITNVRGMDARAILTGAGQVLVGRAIMAGVQNTGVGTLSTASAIYISAPINSGGGTITTSYGIFIEEPTAASSNLAIQTVGGNVIFNSSSGAYNVIFRGDTDTDLLKVDGINDVVAVGSGATVGETKFSVYRNPTGVAGNIYASLIQATYNPGAASAAASTAMLVEAEVASTNAQTFSTVTSIQGNIDHRGTNTITTSRNFSAITLLNSTGGITSASGYYSRVFATGAAIGASWIGFSSDQPVLTAGSVTAYTGFLSTAPTSGAYTTWRGLYVTDPAGATITTAQAIRTDGGHVVLNENGGVWNTRIETDNLANAFLVDGTNDAIAINQVSNTTSLFGMTQPIATSGIKRMAHWVAGAHTGLTATTEVNDVYFDLSRSVNWASGAIATQRAFYVDAPTYSVTAGVSQVITTAATMAISGAPVAAGDGTTITNSYAFWVQTGRIVADGGLLVGAEPTGVVGKVGYTNTVDNSGNSTGVGTILFKGATSRNSSGFLKILDGTTERFLPYFDAIVG